MQSSPLMKDHFNLEYIEKYPYAFGENSGYIKYVEQEFNTVVSFRGEEFIIEGSNEKDILTTKKLIVDMVQKARLKKPLGMEYIKEEIRKIRQENLLAPHLPKTLVVSKQKTLAFKTQKQQEYIENIKNSTISFGIGAAGTGKTYLAIAYAISELSTGSVKKIILTRPVVEAGENLGFLPGTLEEKIAPYLTPLFDAIEEFIPQAELQQLLQKNIIEIVPLAYMRGRSLNHALIILDEAQNTTYLQMKMFLTRLGAHSKMIITGDTSQKDLPFKVVSGLNTAVDILTQIKGISTVYFNEHDSVRHPIIKDIIASFDQYENRKDKEQ